MNNEKKIKLNDSVNRKNNREYKYNTLSFMK